jgi:hypothetical protein
MLMKLIKGLVFSGLLLSISGGAFAANSATFTATAVINQAVSISNAANLNLGTLAVITPGVVGSAVLNLNNSWGTLANVTSGATLPIAARAAVTGTGSSAVSVTLSNVAANGVLTLTGPNATLMTMNLTYGTGASAPAGAGIVVPANNTLPVTLAAGAQNVYVGGTLNLTAAASNAANAGTYTGSFTMTANYT